ncbi:MAG: diguanylate cyclase [Planctomycetes bacterium]|nr:diguanylate cyclase [Planctomycetota bacterium]
MSRIRISIRIALFLALLSASALLSAGALGLFPDLRADTVRRRVALCETLAINCSLLAQKNDVRSIQAGLEEVARRNGEIRSIALRRQNGATLVEIGPHSLHWGGTSRTDDSHMYVPIFAGGADWGKIEVAFEPLNMTGFWGYLASPWCRFVTFVVAMNGLAFMLYLGKTLAQLDPSKVVPDRVRAVLDTFAEGLLVLDDQGRIVLANETMAANLGVESTVLEGRRADELPLRSEDQSLARPWEDTLERNARHMGLAMTLDLGDREPRTFKVNTTPILDHQGRNRGVFASFDDITTLERKKVELMEMLEALQQSRSEIEEQNKQLQFLATRDSLTGCLNRRSFFEQFGRVWKTARNTQGDLCCLMVDIDYFKPINDNHGHAMGDEVLRRTACLLLDSVRPEDLVCRYGGEEFCIVMPGVTLDDAFAAAERLRIGLSELDFEVLSITASMGASSIRLGAADPQEVLDQADKCLYAAKRNGRNQVVRFDDVPPDLEVDESKLARERPEAEPAHQSQIPYHAVSALLSALAYRDPETAAHGARVAELCVATARGMMTAGEIYTVEVAALLHDIGKIGVPDAILLKPGPLTREEWKIMDLHSRIGVEIIAASFPVSDLVNIIRGRHATFGGDPSMPQAPRGTDLPLGARLVSIADAYDAMVSDRVYRKGRSPEETFAELRRAAGKQFDPELVERFIQIVEQRGDKGRPQRSAVSRELALSLGLQTEELARALDAQDLASVRALAAHLEATAAKGGAEQIVSAAAGLRRLSESEPDLNCLVQGMHDLIELCREAQQAHIAMDSEFSAIDRARRQSAAGATTPRTL